ncbi:MAG: hypothetical protein JO057_11295 [Chloroflexi bacterium]|nr:hypothetical protein [Chloroflexota bacterium]
MLVPLILLLTLLASRALPGSAGLVGAACMLVVWLIVRVVRRTPLLWLWTEPMFALDESQMVVHIVDGRLDVHARLRNLGAQGARDLLVRGTAAGVIVILCCVAGATISDPPLGAFLISVVLAFLALAGLEAAERVCKFRSWATVHQGSVMRSRPVVFAYALFAEDQGGEVPSSLPLDELSATWRAHPLEQLRAQAFMRISDGRRRSR